MVREIDGEEGGEDVFLKMVKEDIDSVFDEDGGGRRYVEVVVRY